MEHDTLSAQWSGGNRDGYPAGVPCWVDTTQPDPPAAAEFYRGLLGWELHEMMPPSSPGHYLDRIDDPIRFNSSDICSFSPVGESTPGSVYLWDRRNRMAVVRVFGQTAKVRVLYYRRGERKWTP